MKKFSFIFCLLFGPMFWLKGQSIDKVLAIVGNEVILLSDVEGQFKLMQSQSRGSLPPQTRCYLFDQLLTGALILGQAERDSVKVADEEVDGQIDARLQQILAMMGNSTEQFVSYYNKTPQEVKVEMREDMRKQLVQQQMQQKILDNVRVTPKEVREFFERIPKDSLPYFNSEVELGQIVLKPKVSTESDRLAKERAEDLLKRLKNGADFAQLASTYSDDPGSRVQGGDLGVVPRGTFVAEFEAAAYQLEKGELSGLVKSPFGYHIIQMMERLGNNIRVRHILIRPEINDQDLKQAKAKADSLRNAILANELSFERAVKDFSEDEYSRSRNGELSNPQTGESIWELGDLDPAIYFGIQKLKAGDISEPIEMLQMGGETHYVLVKIRTRTSPHLANLDMDYSKIQRAALEEKKGKTLEDWIKKKIAQFYIELKPGWEEALKVSACENLKVWDKERP